MNYTPRLNRLFAPDGRCFDVAMDHGLFNEVSLLEGIMDMRTAVHTVVEAGPDAIQLSVGQARLLGDIPSRNKPALVLRVDVANVYGKSLPRHLFSQLIESPVEQALRLDATCVVVNILQLPGQPELYHECLRNVARLQPECERYGMTLMVEPLVMRPNNAGSYMWDGDPEKIVPLVRQAVELGANIIKADPTEDPSDYKHVVQAAGDVPVLVRGGGKVLEEEIFRRTHTLLQQGARGIVYGRNVIQHTYPKAMVRALMMIVHDDASPEQAILALREFEHATA